MTFSHPNFNFMGCYTGQRVFFPADLFFCLSLFILQLNSPRCPIIILLCFIWFLSLRTHRHFRNTKAQNVPGTTNMWHMSGLVHFNTEYFTLDRVECHEIIQLTNFVESVKLKNGISLKLKKHAKTLSTSNHWQKKKKNMFMKRKNAYYDYECYLKDML